MKRTKENSISLVKSHIPIWLGSLLVEDRFLGLYQSILSPDEHERARLFKFPKDRIRYIKGRYLLRQISGLYLNEPPQKIRFGYNDHRKPFFLHHPEIFFNLSHSNDLIAIAMTRQSDIGVDLEYINPDMDHDSVSRTVFSRPEVEYFDKGKGDDKIDRFFELWTRKEAFIKALGYGFSMPIDLKDINVLEEKVGFVKTSPGFSDAIDPDWTLHSFKPETGYKAAIAFRKPPVKIRYHKVLGN